LLRGRRESQGAYEAVFNSACGADSSRSVSIYPISEIYHSIVNNSKYKKSIKILIVSGAYPPDHGGGGLRVHRTYRRLSDNHELRISVITVKKKEDQSIYDQYEGIDIYRIKPRKSSLIQFFIIGRLMLNKKLYTYSIMHGVGSPMLVVLASIWAKIFSMKLIREVTVYNNNNNSGIANRLKKYANYFRFYYPLQKTIKKADLVISINNKIKDYYIRLGVHNSRIWNRPNPVDTTNFYFPSEKERSKARNNLGIENDTVVCLLIGKFEERKNQRFAVNLIQKLPKNYILLLVGPISQKEKSYYDLLLTDIHKNKLEKNVKLYPEFHMDLTKYFHSADILIIPSLSEGTPNVMLEAQCCGIPVIINEALQLYEYIEDGINGWNSKLNLDSFVKSIKYSNKIIKNTETKKNISVSSCEKYNFTKIDKDFIKILQKIEPN
jgi:glycosyltransferase involved in cell wall biosynthesis